MKRPMLPAARAKAAGAGEPPVFGRALGALAACVLAALAFGSSAAQAAPITVANNNDAGPGSLRAAIDAANPRDTIVIPDAVGTIALTSGEISITKNLSIQGAGAETTVISGSDRSRVFCARAPTCRTGPSGTQPSLSLSDLQITGGRVITTDNVDGGAAVNSSGGDLTLERVRLTSNDVVFGNGVVDGGGAVFSSGGRVTISDSTIGPDNTVSGGPGATGIDGGGAIFDDGGPIALVNSHVVGNVAKIGGATDAALNGGGGIYDNGGPVTLTNSNVDGNSAVLKAPNGGFNGGAGVYSDGGEVTLDASSIDRNALTVEDAPAHTDGGAGLFSVIGVVTVRHSTVSGNTLDISSADGANADGGAGIYIVGGSTTLDDSTLAANKLSFTAGRGTLIDGGGALYLNGAPSSISRTTIGPDNSASLTVGANDSNSGGGAIFNDGANATLTDSTVAGNRLAIAGAGSTDGGGAIYSTEGHFTLTSATLARNSASGAPGGALLTGGGTSTFKDTIVALNTASSGANCATSGGGTLASAGHNLESSNTCGFGATDILNADTLVGPLVNNGGATETVALLSGSPAIDAGDGNGCPSSDQRGFDRPKGSACDIGAYEFAPPDVVTGATSGITSDAVIAVGVVNPNRRRTTYSFQFGATTAYTSQTAAQDAGEGNTPLPISASIGGLAPATTYHYRLVATNADATSFGSDATFTTASVGPGPPPMGGGPPPAAVFEGVRLKRNVLLVSGKLVIVPVFCPVGRCTGRIALSTRPTKQRLRLGSATFSIAGGRTANVKVRLTTAARKLLARKPTLKALASVTATSNRMTRHTTRSITIRRKRTKAHHAANPTGRRRP